MGIYNNHILPRLTACVLGREPHASLRREITAGLTGKVVEIGFGAGLSLPLLPPAVTHVMAVEPSIQAWKLAGSRIAATPVRVEHIAAPAESLPLATASADAVLMAWTLCSVDDPPAALREIRRILKPGAALHLVEHGISPSPAAARWQSRLTPLQRAVAGGCRLNNDVPTLLIAAGFDTHAIRLKQCTWSPLTGCHYLGCCRARAD